MTTPSQRAYTENEFKRILIRDLAVRVERYESQYEAAEDWSVAQPTISDVVNGKLERLTLKQLCNIAWKSGAGIDTGLYYED